MKSFMDFFVTIEGDDDDVPKEAASEDIDTAAAAARQRVEAGPVGRTPKNKRVADYVDDPYAGIVDEEQLSNVTPDLGSDQPFDEVYKAAGLPASDTSSFTIYKVERLLKSEHLKGLGDRAKAASVLVALEANNIGLDTIIQDAVARDKALDQYDAMLRRDIKNLDVDLQIRNAEIEAQIEDFLTRKRKEIAQNNTKLVEAKTLYQTWAEKKEAEENRLFEAVSPFVDSNPITKDSYQ
jgi:hypothetical protein